MKKNIKGSKSISEMYSRTSHKLTKSMLVKIPKGEYIVWSSRYSWSGHIGDYVRPFKMIVENVNEIISQDIHNGTDVLRLREVTVMEIGNFKNDSIIFFIESRMDWNSESYFYRTERIFIDTWISNEITSVCIEDSSVFNEFSFVGSFNYDTYKDDWEKYKIICKANYKTRKQK